LEECIASIIRVTRIDKQGTTLAVTSNLILHSVLQLLVTVNVPSLPILVTLMMEAIRSSETSVLATATWHNISEDDILHRNHGFQYSFFYLLRQDLDRHENINL
jgi:hypothetical protein